MNSRRTARTAGNVLAVALSAFVSPGPARGDSFGPGEQESWVSATEFAGPGSWTTNGLYFSAVSGGSVIRLAPVKLPDGANITEMRCQLLDGDTGADIQVALSWSEWDRATGAAVNGDDLASVDSGGLPPPGYVVLSDTLNETVRSRTPTTDIYYLLKARVPQSTMPLSFAGCRLKWHRQVSPAPATATFGDVPTGHPYFRAIEALNDSGITQGCGGGNFCPGGNVTRGEMAAFLARALGLSWP